MVKVCRDQTADESVYELCHLSYDRGSHRDGWIRTSDTVHLKE